MTSKDTKSGLTKPKKQERLFPAKQKTMQVRMYEDEMNELREVADAHGVTVSHYVRALIGFDTDGKLFKEDAETVALRRKERNASGTAECNPDVMHIRHELELLRIELSRQGNNLNQMSKVLNRRSSFHGVDEKEIIETKHEVEATHVYVSNAAAQVKKWIDELPSVITLEGDAYGND